MKKPNNIEKEINAIRMDLYEEIKNMSPSEMNAYIKAQVEPIHKKYGICTISETKSNKRRAAS